MNEVVLLGGFCLITLFGMAVVGMMAYQHGYQDALRWVQKELQEELHS